MAASSIASKRDRLAPAVVAALLLLLLGARALAEPAFQDGGPVAAARVIDAETLALTDGRVLRLVDIDVPRGAVATEAKAALATLVASHPLAIKFSGNPQDRQGRVLAQLYAGKVWVQGALLRRGLARVAGTADNRIGLAEMLALERRARRDRRGLWADDAAILPATEAARGAASFALVSGEVARVTANASGVTAFFAANQNGLTLTFAPEVVKLCRAAGLDPAALAGKRLLTRGYIDGTRRPTITVTFPEQIELLKQGRKKAAPKSLSGPPSAEQR